MRRRRISAKERRVCARKKRFATVEEANEAVRARMLNLRPYPCPACKGWHLSSDTNPNFPGRPAAELVKIQETKEALERMRKDSKFTYRRKRGAA